MVWCVPVLPYHTTERLDQIVRLAETCDPSQKGIGCGDQREAPHLGESSDYCISGDRCKNLRETQRPFRVTKWTD